MKKNWLPNLRRKKNRNRKQNRRLKLESLESRELLAVDAFVVDTAVDENDGVGVGNGTSLREALIAADTDPDPTTITFDPSLNGVPLAANGHDVKSPVIISGNGADATIVDANGSPTTLTVGFSGAGSLTLNDLNVTGGGSTGIHTLAGSVTLNRSTVSGNGTGILAQEADVTVTDSTISGNSDGILHNTTFGYTTTLTIQNSTISGNQTGASVTSDYGGHASATISNSTISGNSVGVSAGENYDDAYTSVEVTLQSTIVGDNTTDLKDEAFFGGGTPKFNATDSLIENNSGLINGLNVNNITGVDPQLDPTGLQNNGGPTPTINLQATSPAIDAGSNPLGLADDQRGVGFPREDGGTADIGAIEFTAGDTAPPILTAFARENPATENTDADVLVFRASFDEAVQNVDVADFAVDSLSTATITAIAQVNASTYDVTVSGGDLADFNGVVGLNLAASQDIADIAGNLLPAGEPAIDETYVLANAPTDPVDVLNGLIAEITQLHNDGVFNSGQENALLKKVENLLKSLDKEKFGTAINQLEALANQISAFVNSGILTQAQADGLLEEIDLAIDLIEEL